MLDVQLIYFKKAVMSILCHSSYVMTDDVKLLNIHLIEVYSHRLDNYYEEKEKKERRKKRREAREKEGISGSEVTSATEMRRHRRVRFG